MIDHSELKRLVAQGSLPPVVATLIAENEALRKALNKCAASLKEEMLQKYYGEKPEDMHPVTRRNYDRDMAEIAGYVALSKEG